jgi:hypothetical protein
MPAAPYLIQTHLQNLGISTGQSGAWPCFVGYIPDSPNQMIGIQFTGGFPQDTHLGENLLPTIQIYVRGGEQEHSTVYAKWKAIFDAIENANITDVHLIRAMSSGPLSFPDTKNRSCMTMNVNLVVRNG